VNIAVVAALYGTPWYAPALSVTSDAALLLYGTSMLLPAARGYGGCEVLAISNWLLHRDDQIGCLVFSPIDRLERRLLRGTRPVAGNHVMDNLVEHRSPAPVRRVPSRHPAAPPAQRWTLILGSLTSFLVGLDALVVTTALPTLHEELGVGVVGLSWTVNAYALAFAASILTGSAVGDRLGRRRVFVAGLMLFTLASALCAVSPSIDTLIAARAVQGIGGGIAVPLALALITDVTPSDQRGKAFGIWGAITGVAVAAGPLVGGAVVEGLAWPWVFWLNVPVGIVIAFLTIRKVGESDRVLRNVDPVGLTLATLGVFGIAQALIRGNDAGWTSTSILAGLVGGVIALALFVVWEHRSRYPMIPMTLFGNRGFTGGCVTSFVLMAGVFGLGFLTAQYLQLALHHDPLGVGLRLLPATGVALFLSPVAGRLADRIGDKPLVMLGLGLQATGLVAIGALVTETSGYATTMVPLFIAGAGIAIGFPTVTIAVMRSVGPADAGVASGIGNTFRQVGAVFGIAIAAAVFTAEGGYRSAGEFVDGFGPAMIALGVLSATGVLAGSMIPRSKRVVTSPLLPVRSRVSAAEEKAGE
jgi:EmrB/QacA subfamily drug resistance transporter